ncbi:MAG: DUF72 domain-containing protein [Bacteroidota bacterium]
MDFGKVDSSKLATIDFTLPPDHPITQRVLSGKKVVKPQVYVGCPIWTNKEWLGKIYRPGTKEKDFLPNYTKQFNTIELNTTHYRIPDVDTTERWKLASQPGFTFCPKIPQIISHDKQLQGVEAITVEFCEAVAGLGEYLGITFLQMPPNFGPRHFPVLEKFIQFYPRAIPLAVEFRNQDWFNDEKVWLKTVKMLQHHGISTVITDVAGRRDVLHQSLTTTTAVIRYVGNMAEKTDYSRVDAWVTRIKSWLDRGVEQVYFFVHEHENIISPDVARHFIRALNQQTDLKLAEPRFVVQVVQGSLF